MFAMSAHAGQAQFLQLGAEPDLPEFEAPQQNEASGRLPIIRESLRELGALIGVLEGGWFPHTEVSPVPDAQASSVAPEILTAALTNAPVAAQPDVPDPAQCRDALDASMAGQAILFASGRSVMTETSVALMPAIAGALALCPELPVYVEGHTDSQGAADANLQLSVSRAEAVVDALVDLGIDPARLFAVGYGAGLPIATNDTAEGRQVNRRIVFAFSDDATPVAAGQ